MDGDSKMKPVPEWVAGVEIHMLPRLPSAWLCKVVNHAPPGCTSPQREGKEKREGVCDGHGVVDSEGSDVIECVVQLFTDGLVLHLLCIDFIWTVQRGGGKGAWGEEMEEGRRRGWREDDEMETRTRGMDRRERPEDRPQGSWASSSPSLPWLFFVLCTQTFLSPLQSPRSLWAVL